jgi:hypothetical protein
MATLDFQLREWLLQLPNSYRSEVSRDDVLAVALLDWGHNCSVAEFAAALKRAGFSVVPRGEPGNRDWVLPLPSRPGAPIRHVGRS